MGQIIRSVSINQEQAQFLSSHPELSLSKICQTTINKIMDDSEALLQKIKKLENMNMDLREEIQNLKDKSEEKWIGTSK